MKKIFSILVSLLVVCGINAQDGNTEGKTCAYSCLMPSAKMMTTMAKFSVTATAGTPSFAYNALNTSKAGDLLKPNLGELTIAYKMTPRLSFGISTMSGLNNRSAGYFDQENQFTPFCMEDDDDDEHDEEHEDDDLDDDDIEEEHEDDDDDCDEGEFGDAIMGSATYKLSEKFPLFVQGAGGYSIIDGAPAYSAMIGYNQKIFAGFGIIAGVRYSDVLHKTPVLAKEIISPAGLKVELGASWNF